MFESAEVGNKVDKETYRLEAPKVRANLVQAQRELANADFAVVVVVAGFGGAGKSETINFLLEWLDARGVQVHSFSEPSDEEQERPILWRHWRALPPRGRLAVFFGVWEPDVLLDRAFGKKSQAETDQSLDRVVALERMLHRENVVLVKLWLHLSKAAQRKQYRKARSNPQTRWRVTKQDRKLLERYDDIRPVFETMLRRTNTAEGTWTIVEAADRRYRQLTVAKALEQAIRKQLDLQKGAEPAPPPVAAQLTPPPRNVLNQLDLSRRVERTEYEKQLLELQSELNGLTRKLREKRRSMILVFEGPDAGGKGGVIRRITQAMDARDYRVISVAAPTDEERSHPYLWRFWRNLPRQGKSTIYDRSWYGRVLVERVEGFARPDEWQRAFEEINHFEEQLIDFGIVLQKFWLAISPEEQLRRFRERQVTPYKQYKITQEDWRNRAKWQTYEAAACDMIEKTSVSAAPWVLVEAENKEWGRLKVLRTVVERLKGELRG